MLEISGRVLDLQAIISVGVYRFQPSQPLDSQIRNPELPIRHYRALIDTGAEGTCLTESVIRENRLVSAGKILVQSAGIRRIHRRYLVDIAFWYPTTTDDGDAEGVQRAHGYFGAGTYLAIDIENNDNFDVIIGMDILTKCDFAMWRNGNFTLRM
jgi:hypothetical protein